MLNKDLCYITYSQNVFKYRKKRLFGTYDPSVRESVHDSGEFLHV